MAGCIIFLPGILGSRLTLDGEEIWPPTIGEITGGYRRTGKLTDPRVKAGPPIGKVCLVGVYGPLLDDLSTIAKGMVGAPKRSFHAFGYDWRIDLRDAAEDVVRRIDGLAAADLKEIHFVGHSMGDLVIRLILESGRYDARPWFSSVRTLVSLAGPHRGVPVAMARALGLEGSTGLSGRDIRMMAADPRYPSLYQLLPHSGVSAVWDTDGRQVRGLDSLDTATAGRLGLGAANTGKARETCAILARRRKPAHVNYICLGGSGQDTCIRIEAAAGKARAVAGEEAGDGTVPLWSAIEPEWPHHVAPGVHDAIFRHDDIRAILYKALGARLAGVNFISNAGKPLVSLHASRLVYGIDEIPALMLVSRRAFTRLEGEIVVGFSENPAREPFVPSLRLPLVFGGPATDHIATRLPLARHPGCYRASFEGTHDVVEGNGASFVICGDANAAEYAA